MRRERFTVAVGFDGWALATATAGFSPPSSVAAFLTEVILMGIMRIVVMAYLVIYYTTVRSMSKKMSKKKRLKLVFTALTLSQLFCRSPRFRPDPLDETHGLSLPGGGIFSCRDDHS
mmetsp:Transcript_23491/g.50203  ORF Transcript_23491/g.50203 Transcript_23491/m.50203 type:complete len:117 (-) Transcript_23491:1272-1622(-)